MKAWLDSLAARERVMVIFGAIVLVLLLLYALVWSPVRSGYLELQDAVVGQRETAVWMQESAQRLAQLKSSRGPAASGLGGQSLLALADRTARTDGLGDALKRVEPEGSDSVKVWLEGASFDVLISWLGSLSNKYAINVDTVTLERVGETAGRVNARLTLQAPEL
jgi:general secretion pathway protein M